MRYNKKIVFVHIPKTAGSSFAYFLNEAFGKENVIRDPEKYWKGEFTNPKDYEDKDVIYGHFHIKKYLHLDPIFITFLRDPVDRLLSQYYYSTKPRGVLDNISLIDYASLPMCRNMIKKQIKSLSFFKFIGFQGDFNNSLNKFQEMFDVKFSRRRDIYKRNRHSQNNKVNEKQRNYIRKVNTLDCKLYEEFLRNYHGQYKLL